MEITLHFADRHMGASHQYPLIPIDWPIVVPAAGGYSDLTQSLDILSISRIGCGRRLPQMNGPV